MFLFIILPLAIANILDNIFGNFESPYIHIPKDFHVSFGTQKSQSTNRISIDYSTHFGAAHILFQIEMIGQVANAYINMTNNKIYLRTFKTFVPPAYQCQIFNGTQIPQLQQLSGNQAIILEPDVVFHLMSLYMGTGDDDLARFEISSLLQGRNKAYALFDKEGNLESIEIILENQQQIKLYVLDELEQKVYKETDFIAPTDWDCKKTDMKITTIIDQLIKLLK